MKRPAERAARADLELPETPLEFIQTGNDGQGVTDFDREVDDLLLAAGGSLAGTGAGAGVNMSAVKTPAEARQQAEQEVHGWHARLKVEHKKMNETERSELCRLIEQEHRWPAPMEIDEDSAKYGSSFRCPITSCHHARGYEQCREQERGWVNELKSQFKRNPWSLKNAGLVNVDGVEKRGDFSFSKWMEGKTYKNKVFGHQHSSQAILECHEEDPEEIAFRAFETKIYIGLTPDMVRFLGEHQNTVDMAVKGRTNTDLIKGIRTTLQEKHGVLY
ncbi:hypothetical protein CYMTET_3785 [Cymbomonas tetramitiformis]|uniref:Uncharacterized protein n=1 Tax=Cymbomonas tetramitiformis TaxID=36881 RepID=A0AAE0H2M2_9CHLO|nr:hypothetical protein CYMTET_3785 [Cymbomonas tetramitiformis]